MRIKYFVGSEVINEAGFNIIRQERHLEYRKVMVKRIYDVRVCLRFAKGAWGCQRMTILGWSRSII